MSLEVQNMPKGKTKGSFQKSVYTEPVRLYFPTPPPLALEETTDLFPGKTGHEGLEVQIQQGE